MFFSSALWPPPTEAGRSAMACCPVNSFLFAFLLAPCGGSKTAAGSSTTSASLGHSVSRAKGRHFTICSQNFVRSSTSFFSVLLCPPASANVVGVPNNASMPYVALVGRGHGPSQQPWARVGPTQINFHLPVPSAVHIGASTSALADDGEEQQYFGVTRHGWRRKAAPSNGEDYWDGLRRAKSGRRGKARRRAGAGRGKEEPVPGVLLAAAKITPKQGTKQSMAGGIRYEHWQLWDGSKPAFVALQPFAAFN